MVPDGRTEWTDGRHQNYIPPTLSGDNNEDPTKMLHYTIIDFNEVDIRIYLPEKVIIHRGR